MGLQGSQHLRTQWAGAALQVEQQRLQQHGGQLSGRSLLVLPELGLVEGIFLAGDHLEIGAGKATQSSA